MTTKIEARWQHLQPAPDKPVFQLLDAQHPLMFYVGREMTGEFLFLLIGDQKPVSVKSMRSVAVKSFERPDGKWALLLSLSKPELSGLFALLCEDLAASSKHLSSATQGTLFVCRRLASWRALLESGRASLLSPSEVRGLFGELWLLDRHLLSKLGSAQSTKAWVGPYGADQDYQTVDEAYEVKTVQPDATTVCIASESQLYSSTRALKLVVLSLGEAHDTNGTSLNSLVSRLRALLANDSEARDAFEERLDAARYLAREEYDAPMFRVVHASIYNVSGDFPRILPMSLSAGICAVNYQISLPACAPYQIDCPFNCDPNES